MSIVLALRLFLVVLFARTAWHKWHAATEFRAQLHAYRLLPDTLVPAVALLLALAETCCIFLLIWLSSNSGVLLALALLALYTLAMAINLVRGHHDIDCGCSTGRSAPKKLSYWLLVRNLLLMLAAISGLSNITITLLGASDFILACIVTTTLVLVLESFEQALANVQHHQHWRRIHS